MSGSLSEMSLGEAQRDQQSEQSRLSSFDTDDTTYVGIVSEPSDEFRRIVDEIEHRLSPPDELFYQWLALKDKGQSHNEALESVNYQERFEDYLRKNDDVRSALFDIAGRVSDGEEIVLVCYCGEGKWCHRYAVVDRIHDLLDAK